MRGKDITPFTKKEEVTPKWYLVDASGAILGRLASEVARRIRGKHHAAYTPQADTGDYIVVVNASKIKVTGKKRTDKMYYRHSLFPGGLKSAHFDKMMEKHPEKIISLAVEGMLPKGRLGRTLIRKLKVYKDGSHPHAAQRLEELKL